MVLYGRAVSDYGLKVLEGCQNLKELHLVETSVTDKGLASLANLRSLRWLSIDTADVTDSGIMQLKNLNLLEGLQLVKTGCSDDGLAILLNLPHLEYLEISGCTIAERRGAIYFPGQLTQFLETCCSDNFRRCISWAFLLQEIVQILFRHAACVARSCP